MNQRTEEIVRRRRAELTGRYPVLEAVVPELETGARLLAETLAGGGKVLVCGNGGSAADAGHIVGELMKGFVNPRPLPEELRQKLRETDPLLGDRIARGLQQGLPAVDLGAHEALLSAFANDQDPVLVYAQQTAGFGRKGDLLWCLSTSGNAANVVHAAVTARALGLRVLSMTGKSGGELLSRSDLCLRVPETETYRVQELHLPVYHFLCLTVEEILFG